MGTAGGLDARCALGWRCFRVVSLWWWLNTGGHAAGFILYQLTPTVPGKISTVKRKAYLNTRVPKFLFGKHIYSISTVYISNKNITFLERMWTSANQNRALEWLTVVHREGADINGSSGSPLSKDPDSLLLMAKCEHFNVIRGDI